MSKMLTINIPSSVYNKIQSGDYLKALVNSGVEPLRAIVEWFMHEKLKTHGEFPSVRKANLKTSEKALRDLVVLDMQTLETIIMCLDLSLRDEFWKDQILSISNIRKTCSNGITKYEHILQKVLKTKKESRSGIGSFKLL